MLFPLFCFLLFVMLLIYGCVLFSVFLCVLLFVHVVVFVVVICFSSFVHHDFFVCLFFILAFIYCLFYFILVLWFFYFFVFVFHILVVFCYFLSSAVGGYCYGGKSRFHTDYNTNCFWKSKQDNTTTKNTTKQRIITKTRPCKQTK